MKTITLDGKKYSEREIAALKEDYMRLEAVDKCFALELLVKDKAYLIRCAVARKHFGHDLLIHDENWRVRATVAQYTHKREILETLAHDAHDFVRFVVAKRGVALEHLSQDIDEEISSIAKYQLQQLEVA